MPTPDDQGLHGSIITQDSSWNVQILKRWKLDLPHQERFHMNEASRWAWRDQDRDHPPALGQKETWFSPNGEERLPDGLVARRRTAGEVVRSARTVGRVSVTTQAQQLRIVCELGDLLGAGQPVGRQGHVGTGAVGIELHQPEGEVERALRIHKVRAALKQASSRRISLA